MAGSQHSANVAYYDALADTYNLFFRDFDQSMEEEGHWLDALFRPRGVRRVLDASCGTGRQAIPLVKRGYEVIAADPSAAMLREAAANAKHHEVSFRALQLGFADLPLHFDEEFDAVIALGNGLCHLQEKVEILAALRAMYHCCTSPGVCVIGIKDFDRILTTRKRFHAHNVVDRGDRRTILFEVWDFSDPFLVSTAYALEGPRAAAHGPTQSWEARSAQTQEYMLRAHDLERLSCLAQFGRCERIVHPCEAAYVLTK